MKLTRNDDPDKYGYSGWIGCGVRPQFSLTENIWG